MADVLILFAAALIVMGGGFAVWLVARSGRKAREIRNANRPNALRNDLQRTDDYIREVGQVLTDSELDRLARRYKEKES
jgi:hypothetical protein